MWRSHCSRPAVFLVPAVLFAPFVGAVFGVLEASGPGGSAAFAPSARVVVASRRGRVAMEVLGMQLKARMRLKAL